MDINELAEKLESTIRSLDMSRWVNKDDYHTINGVVPLRDIKKCMKEACKKNKWGNATHFFYNYYKAKGWTEKEAVKASQVLEMAECSTVKELLAGDF